jgi:TadE-like protein
MRTMISALRRLFRCTTATAAVEAAIFTPIFVTLSLGITDLGSEMFVRMTVNAATQAGAAYAVIKSGSECVYPATLTCLNNIQAAMNDATNNSSFCTGTVCTASIKKPCDDGSPECITVTANYPFSPIFPVTNGIFSQSWTKTMTVSSTTTIRVQ